MCSTDFHFQLATPQTLIKTITRPVFHDNAWLDWDTELFEVVRCLADQIDMLKITTARTRGRVPHVDLHISDIKTTPIDIEVFSETGWRVEIHYALTTHYNGGESTHPHPIERLDHMILPEGVHMSDLPLLRLGKIIETSLKLTLQAS